MLKVQKFTFNPFQENTYILYNEAKQCCIIDPGCYDDNERKQLVAFIKKENLQPVLLLNTHCHVDHVFGNEFVSKQWELPLYIHLKEQFILDNAVTFGQMYGLEVPVFTGNIIYLKENTTIKVGEDELDILFTPGHSPGSVSFYAKADDFVISGDALFSGSIGRTDLPMGDYDTLIASIKTQLYSLPDSTKVFSGHGGGTSIGHEKANNPFVQAD